MESLSGSVERITYYNAENGYSVIRLLPESKSTPGANREGLVTAVGNLPELAPGEFVRLRGSWTNHPRHGFQFQVEVCEQTVPATVTGIRRYLGSGLIKGIGPRLADRIVDRFGEATLDVIDHEPERLVEVQDIGPKRSRMIARAWDDQRQVKEIMVYLHGHGVTTNLAIKIFKQYGDRSMQVVESDPYRLARDIHGVGFKTADRLARDLGLPTDHPSRIQAGVVYALNQIVEDGHVYSPQEELTRLACDLLEVDPDVIPPALDELALDDRIRLEPIPEYAGGKDSSASRTLQEAPAVYLTPLYHSEIGVASRLQILASAIPSRLSTLPPSLIEIDPELSAEQRRAIVTALTHPVSILTGGPGTGKTRSIQALVQAAEQGNKTVALCAPTGRAAKRLSEAAGRPASTIHRLLEYSPRDGFAYNLENPLPVDLVVVDEVSMLELLLAYNLLKALEPGTHVLFVGDVDQLPSVGAGDVLRDLIASGVAPVTRLTEIFRQAADSSIITNAHRINRGEMPLFTGADGATRKEGDFFIFPADSADDAAQWVVELVSERIPGKFGLDPVREIQVLSPMYRGPAGVHALNSRLQERLNPPEILKPERTLFGQTFRPGDKVMQTQNDYDRDVFNGDIGSVTSISAIDQTLEVEFNGRRTLYDWSDADELVLAYAVSVHKSQGAEFPAVVLPLITQHFLMLQRNLLYTAVTRARDLCVIAGSRRAIAIAVQNNQVAHRHSALAFRLMQR